ncbi:hypothetical protein BT69DRAFT_318480 [Atractiella rhizophila]|nr:hypothetical protein BT69DRAFT_318480 [Atractiella rhizophila]
MISPSTCSTSSNSPVAQTSADEVSMDFSNLQYNQYGMAVPSYVSSSYESLSSENINDQLRLAAQANDPKGWPALSDAFLTPATYQAFSTAADDLKGFLGDQRMICHVPDGALKEALRTMKTEEISPSSLDYMGLGHFYSPVVPSPAQPSFAPSVFSPNTFLPPQNSPTSPVFSRGEEHGSQRAQSSRAASEAPSIVFSVGHGHESGMGYSPASSTEVFVKTEDIFSNHNLNRSAESMDSKSPNLQASTSSSSTSALDELPSSITDHDAGMIVTRSQRPLVIFWDPNSRRPVISTSANLATRFSHYQTVRFETGTHYEVTPLSNAVKDDGEINGQQPKPWSGKGPGNFWLKAQVLPRKKCECGFSFLGGREAEDYFKRPSVIREHIVSCKEWESEDPLKQLCSLHRQADKSKQRNGRRNPSSQSRPVKRTRPATH